MANVTKPIATLSDAELLDLLRAQRKVVNTTLWSIKLADGPEAGITLCQFESEAEAEEHMANIADEDGKLTETGYAGTFAVIDEEGAEKDDLLELDTIQNELADRIIAYIEIEGNEATAAIVNGFRASATWHQEGEAWSEDSQTIVAAAKEYARRELRNYLDQQN